MDNKKILIVEDDAILRDILVNKFIKAGFATFTAEDGERALELARAELPAVVLLDIILPKKSGEEVLEEMQKDAKLKNIPVIAISNSGETTEIARIKELGAKDFLVKALFDSNDVLARVGKLLGMKLSPTGDDTPRTMPSPAPTETNPAPTGAPQSATAPAAGGAKKSVLIVEDDKFLRELASQKLQAEGFIVYGATNGNEAIAELEKTPVDVIILDLILPGMDGYEVLKQVKGSEKLSKIPVIILSNLGQAEDIEKAKSLGADDYLVKAHFSFGEIIKKIRSVLGIQA